MRSGQYHDEYLKAKLMTKKIFELYSEKSAILYKKINSLVYQHTCIFFLLTRVKSNSLIVSHSFDLKKQKFRLNASYKLSHFIFYDLI